jgi:hypothetical protein
MKVDDRRAHPRIEPEGATADVVVMGVVTMFDVDNLSEGGALVQGRIDVPLGTIVDLSLHLPDAPSIAMSARVQRHTPRGDKEFTALVFQKPSDALKNWISDIVLQGLRAAFPEI